MALPPLKPYQSLALDHLLAQPRAALWLPMGAGKTRTVLEALDRCHHERRIHRTLIVAPKRVCESVWGQEAAKWGMPLLAPTPILGTPAQRKAALRARTLAHSINFENLPWLLSTVKTWPWDCVVVDESSRLGGFRLRQGTKQAKALARVIHQVHRHIQLTGTPAPNGLERLWGQAWFLDRGERLGRTYTDYLNRWFRQISINGGQWTKIKPMPHAQEEIQERLADLCLSINLADYLSIDEPIASIVPVMLPPQARKVYDRMERDFFVEISGTEIEARNAAAKSMKLLQLASGCVLDNSRVARGVHVAKIEALRSVIEEANGAPVIVAYHFKADLARLKRAFPIAEELTEKNLERWNAGGIPILLLHPMSAGHGLNLQDGGNIMIFFSNTWNLEHRLQTIERIGPTRQLQSGHPRPVYVYDLVAEHTLDEVVLERHRTKREVQDLLLEAVKARKR
jgi:SNF2 family DNA or RNA helicase